MEGETKNLTFVFSSVVASLCYGYFVSARIPAGKYRFISLLPVFYSFTVLPLSLSFALTCSLTTLCITWLGNFKLLLFAFEKGPLSHSPSLLHFITVASFPVKIKQQKKDIPVKIPTKTYFVLGLYLFLYGLQLDLLNTYGDNISPATKFLTYFGVAFVSLEAFFGSCHLITRLLLNVELEPISDKPYLSTSLRDFWGHRWNRMVSDTLRQTIYNPVRSASVGYLGEKWAPRLAVLASFVVSGLFHELMRCYVTRLDPTWELTSMFVIHGICHVLESCLKSKFAGKYQLPAPVARVLTLGFISVTFYRFIYVTLTRTRTDVRYIEELIPAVHSVKTSILKLFN